MWILSQGKNITKFFQALSEGLLRPFVENIRLLLVGLFDFDSLEWGGVFLGGSWVRPEGASSSDVLKVLKAKGFTGLKIWEGVSLSPKEVLGIEVLSRAGVDFMAAGNAKAKAGYYESISGYLLVNKISANTVTPLCQSGGSNMAAGNSQAKAGNYYQTPDALKNYTIPTQPYSVVYIGGESKELGELLELDGTRKTEFDTLCLRYFPSNVWVGVLIDWKFEPDNMLYEDGDKMLYEDSGIMQYEEIK